MQFIALMVKDKLDYTVHILIFCLLIGSLVGFGDLFIRPEFTSLYLYESIASILIVCSAIKLLIYKETLFLSCHIQQAIIFYGTYILIHGLWIKGNFNPYHNYILISCLLAVSLPVLINKENIKKILQVVILVAFIEAVYCLLQKAAVLPSLSNYFEVTGTFANPNVTAMFLAMALCLIPYIYHGVQPAVQKAAILTGIVIAFALICLQCRSALLGLACAGLVQLYFKEGFRTFCRHNLKKPMGIFALVVLGVLSVSIGLRVYQGKKASADGRKLIWKISTQMIKDQPLLGFGFGDFERSYNLYQANYFKEGRGSDEEKQQADHVNMAYNEILQHGVSGGILGILLFVGLSVAVLIIPFRERGIAKQEKTGHIAFASVYSCLVCFFIMGIFNFTLQAIPVTALFVICLAILMAQKKQRNNPERKQVRLVYAVIAVCLIGGGLLLLLHIFQTASYAAKNKTLVAGAAKDSQSFEALASRLSRYETYWISHGDMLLKSKDYNEALKKYQVAQGLSSEKGLYLGIAACNEQLGNETEAIKNYELLSYMQPGWLQPKYRLLKIYQKQNDTAHIVKQALEIVALRPKVKSKKSRYYQNYAKSVLMVYKPDSLAEKPKISKLKFPISNI